MIFINVFVLSLFILLSVNAQQSSKKPPKKPKPVSINWVNKPSKNLPTGVTHRTYKSKVAKKNIGYCIYLPPSYETSKDKRYPVIYDLHGNGGNELRVVE
jgi:predicted peptidase